MWSEKEMPVASQDTVIGPGLRHVTQAGPIRALRWCHGLNIV
jgi:hypothetical protein